MSVVAGLLLAIRASPKDRLPQLVFTDWIEDRGYHEEAISLRERVGQPWVWLDPLDRLRGGAWCEAVIDIGFTNSETADLGGTKCPVSDRLLTEFAAVRAPRLRWVGLKDSPVTEAGVRAVLQADDFPRLRAMDLRGVPLPDGLWAVLSTSPISYLRFSPPACECDRTDCECGEPNRDGERQTEDLEADDWLLRPARCGRAGRNRLHRGQSQLRPTHLPKPAYCVS